MVPMHNHFILLLNGTKVSSGSMGFKGQNKKIKEMKIGSYKTKKEVKMVRENKAAA